MTLQTFTLYVQGTAATMGAIYNGVMVHDHWGKWWKVLGAALCVALLAFGAYASFSKL